MKKVILSDHEREKNIPDDQFDGLKDKLGKVELYEVEADIKPGQEIPSDLIFMDHKGSYINLFEIARDQNIVIFVYPGNKRGLEYPELYGCTPEACSFRDKANEFANQNTLILGASIQPSEQQKVFADLNHFTFPIISDKEKKLSTMLGIRIWRATDTGEEFLERSTIVIKRGGILHEIIRNIQVAGHVDEVLGKVQEMEMINRMKLTR